MSRGLIFSCLFLSLLSGLGWQAAQAAEAKLTVDLARDRVDITAGFNGSDLVLFGMAEKNTDVAVVVRGPKRDVVTRRKDKVMGVWMNREGVRFQDVPLFYDYALSRPEEDILSADALRAHGIGIGSLRFQPKSGRYESEKIGDFQSALVRNRQSVGLFPLKPKPITFLNNQLFKITFHVPANVPTGDYEIETFLIKGKNVKESHITKLTVAQVGFSAGIFKFSHHHAFIYAVLCLLFAVFAGWFSNRVSRKT